jgi:hypothetical protein
VNQDCPDVDERKLLIVSVTLHPERDKSRIAAPTQWTRSCLGSLMTTLHSVNDRHDAGRLPQSSL